MEIYPFSCLILTKITECFFTANPYVNASALLKRSREEEGKAIQEKEKTIFRLLKLKFLFLEISCRFLNRFKKIETEDKKGWKLWANLKKKISKILL